MSAGRNILIRMTNKSVAFNETFQIPLEKTNLPVGHFQIVESRKVYWLVEMLEFDKELHKLLIKIVDYRPKEIDNFFNQNPKSEIYFLEFKDIYWPYFSGDLSFYKKNSFLHLCIDEIPKDKTTEIVVKVNEDINIKKLTFGLGFVTFHHMFHWSDELIEIKIHNSHILPEFEYIKPFFSKHFGSKKIRIEMLVTKDQNKTISTKASSPQIDEIKEWAIETMKFVKVERLRNPKKYYGILDKSLFTADDIFQEFDKSMLGTYPMSQQELVEQIMKWDDIRNKVHLEYLAANLHDMTEKIRFTLTPKFGFLFVTRGDRMIHYIWEMLNTNATYIWSMDESSFSHQKQLEKMEEVLSYIRNNGRESYLHNVVPNEGILFRRVNHQGVGSIMVDYFPKWRANINEAMV